MKNKQLSNEAKKSTSDGRRWYVEAAVQEFIDNIKESPWCDDHLKQEIDERAGENFNNKPKKKENG